MEESELLKGFIHKIEAAPSNVELIFCKKMPKTYKNKYRFVRGQISDKISRTLSEWLVDNLEKLRTRVKERDYNGDDFETILSNINHWEEFESAIKATVKLNTSTERLEDYLKAFIVSFRIRDQYIGYIRRIKPGNVLKRGPFRLFFEESTFRDISRGEMIEIDENADFIFYKFYEYSNGHQINPDNFDEIFDMYEKYKIRAMENLNLIGDTVSVDKFDNLMSLVKDDRKLQKRLNTSFIQKGIGEFTQEKIIQIIKEVSPKTQLKLKISDDGESLTYDIIDQKEAVGDLLDVFGYKYNKPLLTEHLSKAQPQKFYD